MAMMSGLESNEQRTSWGECASLCFGGCRSCPARPVRVPFSQHAGEELFPCLSDSPLVPKLLRCLEDLGSEGRRRVHCAQLLHLERVPRQVRPCSADEHIYVWRSTTPCGRGLGGVEGLAEVVGDEGADGADTGDMEAHWPVLRVSRVGRARLRSKRCLHPPRLEYGKTR